jgi:2'-5' RNA ligase
MKKRLFTAINLPPSIREELASLAGRVDRREKEIRWVPPENIHLTLHFLGWVEEETQVQIEQILEHIVPRHRSMQLTLATLGAFPSWQNPRIFWIGIRDKITGKESKELATLQEELNDEFLRLGMVLDDRPFSPHITLARIKGRVELLAYKVAVESLPFNVETVDLMQSILSAKGPTYHILKKFSLHS